jgi:prevent-host-death family protein
LVNMITSGVETVSVHEAKTHLSRLLAQVAEGRDIVITNRGRPVARLTAVGEPPRRKLGWLPGHIPDSFFEPLPEEELRAWEGG